MQGNNRSADGFRISPESTQHGPCAFGHASRPWPLLPHSSSGRWDSPSTHPSAETAPGRWQDREGVGGGLPLSLGPLGQCGRDWPNYRGLKNWAGGHSGSWDPARAALVKHRAWGGPGVNWRKMGKYETLEKEKNPEAKIRVDEWSHLAPFPTGLSDSLHGSAGRLTRVRATLS